MKKQRKIHVRIIEISSLGDRSYLVHDGNDALVIDPQRDIDVIIALAEEEHITIKAILETHIHNDYVSGGFALSKATRAKYYIATDEPVEFERVPIAPNDLIEVGSLKVKAIHTPGHTHHHLAYLVSLGEEQMIFTGGSLLYGTVGRTDLIDKIETEPLTKAQFASVKYLANILPDDTQVFPTHGFGSFCSTLSTSNTKNSTIQEEKTKNIAFSLSEKEFVRQVMGSLSDYPSYYSHMAPLNRQGAKTLDLEQVGFIQEKELLSLLERDVWVVDMRERTIFAKQHEYNTVNIEMGNSFVTYVGWIIPWEKELLLIGESKEQIKKAQKELSRIGKERLQGATTAAMLKNVPSKRKRSYPVATFKEVKEKYEEQGIAIVDVRRIEEWNTSHIKGAVNIPIHTLSERINELPQCELWVHCASGFRAAIGASILHKEGRNVVLINDDYNNAEKNGLPIIINQIKEVELHGTI